MRRFGTWLSGIGLGAAVMYLWDPQAGRRRRALIRDQAIRAWHKSCDAADATGRDLRNRAIGMGAEMRARFRHGENSPEVIAARVRSKLGRYVSHPGSIEVEVEPDGRVTLSGPVLRHEANAMLGAVATVRGVHGVDDRLEVHDQPGDVPGLQGGLRRPGERFELMQENWSPAARLLTGLAGSALLFYGIRRRHPGGIAVGALGLGLLARGATNLETKRLLGFGGGRRAVDVQKTLHIGAPLDVVWKYWSSYENFPRFMSHVREVRETGPDRSHWVVDGPAGVPVEWDAEVTRRIPGEVLAWRSMPNSPVGHAGIVRFQERNGGTTVEIRLSYNPPAGALGHMVASFFGADPKRQMDDDLARLKTLLETGHSPRDAAAREGTFERTGVGAGRLR